MANLIGQTLSRRYKIEDSIGRGGMAEVYKAWDNHRSVYLALKMLRQDLAEDAIFLHRFRMEAQTLKKLQHPNIVRFYDIERDDFHVFMLMDYIEGTTLQRVLFMNNDVPLDLRYIFHIMQSVCAALRYAHNMGLVHCDIKPGNIMTDNSGKVLLTDFGIARMTDAATATMVGYGTPAYMAPELINGQDPTPQSDIYSLGVLLYEMVTGGKRPFTGEQARTTGSTIEKVRWEQVHLDPPSPRQYNPELSPVLESIILKCLSKNPQSRYSSPIEIIQAFEALSLTDPQTNIEGDQKQCKHKPVGLQNNIVERQASNANVGKGKRFPRWLLWGAGVLALGLVLMIFGKVLVRQDSTLRISVNEIIKPSMTIRSELSAIQELTTEFKPTLQATATITITPAPSSTKSPTRTSSVYITPTPKVYNPIAGCASSHLHVGDSAFVSYVGGKNHVRTKPDTAPSNNILFDIYPGEVVQIIGGPECNYGWILWKIETTYLKSGWTPESDGNEFWLFPIATRSICKDALPTRLVVGKKAKVNEEPPQANLLREGPGRNYTVIDRIRPGCWMMVLEGPECGEAVNWWKVESLNTGTIGWTMEGDKDIYYLSPEP